MTKYIDAEPLYNQIVEKEELARQRVIDTPSRFPNGNINPYATRYATQLDERTTFKFMLTDAPAANVEPVQRWIPVTDRFPEKYGQYLVTFIPSGGTLWTKVLIARYSDLMGIAKPSFHIGEVGKNSFANINEQVIAWMPLPEPYKGGEEE